MLISKRSLVCLASEGRFTLQIPMYSVGGAAQDIIEIPDDWICFLGSDMTPRKNGYMYFTKKGFEAYQDKLKKAFEAYNARYPQSQRGTWQDYVNEANKHFAQVETKRQQEITKLKARLELLENMN